MTDYIRLACVSILFANDMKHIHLHSVGKNFDRIHKLTEEYYNQVSDESDYLCELAIENGQSMVNPTQAGTKVPEWIPESGSEYGYADAVAAINTKLSMYLRELEVVRDSSVYEDIKSKLDDMMRYWNKELRYKMVQRSKLDCSNDCEEGLEKSLNTLNTPLNCFVNHGTDEVILKAISTDDSEVI